MKKGFILVETIVVITFLATSLLIIYSSFNGILVNEKRRMYYDDPIYLYRTYYILDLLQSNNVFNYIEDTLADNDADNYPLLLEVSCNNTAVFKPGSDAQILCESIVNTKYLEVEHIYFTYYDLGPLTACKNSTGETCDRNESLRGLSTNAVNYLNTLTGTGDGYRIIIEFLNQKGLAKKYFYASLDVPLGGNGS